MTTIKISIPVAALKALEELCFIDIEGELTVRMDKRSALARECFLRGLKQVIEERMRIESGES